MFEQSIRPLTPTEQARLRRELRHAEMVARRARRKMPWPSIGMSGLLFALAVWMDRQPLWIVASIWVAVLAFVLLRSYFTAYFRTQKRIDSFKSALHVDRANVTRVIAESVAELSESNDEGPFYAFQIEPNEVLFFCDSDVYAGDFPNSDFELVEVKDAGGGVATLFVHRHGKKLEPIRKLPRSAWKILRPAHLQILDGRVERLEAVRKPVWA